MQRKDQIFINKQLYQYLCTQNRMDDFLQPLSTDGYCYSYSLCRAAMRVTGKLKWWEEARDNIISWDRQASSLDKEITLPDADEGKPILLKTIFERVTHYIVYNQALERTYPHVNFNQDIFLHPNGPFLLLQSNGESLRIKKNYVIAGLSSVEDLIQSLQDEVTIAAIKDNICLVSSGDHTCELSYVDNRWHLYDPNYRNGKSKSFVRIEDLITEMRVVLGRDLRIELACMRGEIVSNPNALPFSYYYNELLDKHPEKLVQYTTLPNILKCSALILRLLNNLKQQNKIQWLNLNQGDSNGWTPLMLAADNSHIDAVKALCDAGADPNYAMTDGTTVLMLAAEFGRADAIKALCDAGADPNYKTPAEGRTALIVASQADHADTVKALCDAGANPNYMTPDGWTAMMYAAQFNHSDAIKVLCDSGADPNLLHPCGSNSLMLAAQYGHINVVELLLNRTDLTTTMLANMPVLLYVATQKNRRQEIEAFFKNQHQGVLPDTIPGFTALHTAVFFGHTQIVSLLLNKMSNLRFETLENICQIAETLNHPEIIYSLQLRMKNILKSSLSTTVATLFECKDKNQKTLKRSLFTENLNAKKRPNVNQ